MGPWVGPSQLEAKCREERRCRPCCLARALGITWVSPEHPWEAGFMA